MKKVVLVGVLVIFLLSATIYVFSQSNDSSNNLPSDGESMDQSTVDSVNEDNLFLDCKSEPVTETEEAFFYVTSCLKIVPDGENYYVVREPYVHIYSKAQYEECLQTYSAPECHYMIKSAWQKEHEDFKASIRQEINTLQSSSGSANADFSALILSESELNQ